MQLTLKQEQICMYTYTRHLKKKKEIETPAFTQPEQRQHEEDTGYAKSAFRAIFFGGGAECVVGIQKFAFFV